MSNLVVIATKPTTIPVTLFKPGWAEFAPHTTASPPGFKKLSTPLSKGACAIFVKTHTQNAHVRVRVRLEF